MLVLTVCAAPLLHRYSDEHLAVVHGAVNNATTISSSILINSTTDIDDTYPAVTQINANASTTLNINKNASIAMMNDSGHNDDSEIQVYGGATLNLYGKITGSFDKLSVSSTAKELS